MVITGLSNVDRRDKFYIIMGWKSNTLIKKIHLELSFILSVLNPAGGV